MSGRKRRIWVKGNKSVTIEHAVDSIASMSECDVVIVTGEPAEILPIEFRKQVPLSATEEVAQLWKSVEQWTAENGFTAKQEREQVTEEALLEILNSEMNRHQQCEECRFTGPVVPLAEEDEHGCNWSVSLLRIRCSGRETDSCRDVAARVAQDISERYNLMGEG